MGNNGAGWAQEPRQDPGGISCALRDSQTPQESGAELGSHPGISWWMFRVGKEPQGSGSSAPAQPSPKIPPGAIPAEPVQAEFPNFISQHLPGWAHPAPKSLEKILFLGKRRQRDSPVTFCSQIPGENLIFREEIAEGARSWGSTQGFINFYKYKFI